MLSIILNIFLSKESQQNRQLKYTDGEKLQLFDKEKM